MNGVKRVVFNQIVTSQEQIDHVSAFMDIAIRNPKRKFRIILEEVEPVNLVDPNADTKVMATLDSS